MIGVLTYAFQLITGDLVAAITTRTSVADVRVINV